MMAEIDWDQVGKEVGTQFLEALKGFAKGELADLKEFAEDMGRDALRAAREGREDLLSELAAQAKVAAEIKRIRLEGFAWEQVGQVLAALGRLAAKVLLV